MHEVVFTDKKLKSETGVKTLDVAKRLIDYGFHPPTVYFPLVVARGALMIEPTETETKRDARRVLRRDARHRRRGEAATPSSLKTAPHAHRASRRLDETKAARHPKLRWTRETDVAAA